MLKKQPKSALLRVISTASAASIVAATFCDCSRRSIVSCSPIFANRSVSSFASAFMRAMTSATFFRSYAALEVFSSVAQSTPEAADAFFSSRSFCFWPMTVVAERCEMRGWLGFSRCRLSRDGVGAEGDATRRARPEPSLAEARALARTRTKLGRDRDGTRAAWSARWRRLADSAFRDYTARTSTAARVRGSSRVDRTS